VVLQPETLIYCVVSIVRRMGDVEVDEVPSVDEARRVGRHGSLQCDANKLPFSDVASANAVGDKKKLVRAFHNLLSQDGCWRNRRSSVERRVAGLCRTLARYVRSRHLWTDID
jgi:hypothetical protein